MLLISLLHVISLLIEHSVNSFRGFESFEQSIVASNLKNYGFCGSDWNPHADLQAMARAHRLGQQNKVKLFNSLIV